MNVSDSINSTARKIPSWSLYILSLLPIAWLVWQTLVGGMGVDPIKAIEHQLGIWALQVFIATMTISPLRKFAGINLLKFRRALGLICFSYVALHLSVWLLLDLQLYWGEIWKDILKRPYITIGMGAFILMIPMAVTSNNAAIKRLGAMRWQKLHKLAYLAVLLGAIHFVMVQKVWETDSLTYLGIIVFLLFLRFRQFLPKPRKQSV